MRIETRPLVLVLVLVALVLVALGLAAGCPTTARVRQGSPPPSTSEVPTSGTAQLSVWDIASLEVERAAPAALEEGLAAHLPLAVRARAALALARAEHVEAAAPLLRAAEDPHPLVRERAYFGIGQMDLALEIGRPRHDELRDTLEQFLVERLAAEEDRKGRLALVRALGRLSVGPGHGALIALARGDGADDELRAEALYALGVSGARRQASLFGEPSLLAAVLDALSSPQVEVRRGAAYAAFRQKLPLPPARFVAIPSEPDATTRIHLTRALKERIDDPGPAMALLSDADWRVRVEAVRALEVLLKRGQGAAVEAIASALQRSADRLGAPGASGEAHILTTGCAALSSPDASIAADRVRPHLVDVVGRLREKGPSHATVLCACSVALDALDAKLDAVRRCAPLSWPKERVRRLEVEVAARARISTRERAMQLEAALSDPSPVVRSAAAWALVGDASTHAAKVAAKHLEREEDAAVAGTLLHLFQGAHEDVLSDEALRAVVERFATAARTLEKAEPLLEAAPILRARSSALAREALGWLERHPEPRVREAARGIPYGERSHGPRANAKPPPPPAELPLAAILETERGPIRIAFDRELAPIAVANFAALAQRGFFDGTRFHRVVPDFVAQGGDPRGDGSGGPGYTIACENHDGRYTRGAVGMALAGKDTGGSQFFLTHSEQPHLDGRYTLFARVVEGLEVMDAITEEDRLLTVRLLGAVPAR